MLFLFSLLPVRAWCCDGIGGVVVTRCSGGGGGVEGSLRVIVQVTASPPHSQALTRPVQYMYVLLIFPRLF